MLLATATSLSPRTARRMASASRKSGSAPAKSLRFWSSVARWSRLSAVAVSWSPRPPAPLGERLAEERLGLVEAVLRSQHDPQAGPWQPRRRGCAALGWLAVAPASAGSAPARCRTGRGPRTPGPARRAAPPAPPAGRPVPSRSAPRPRSSSARAVTSPACSLGGAIRVGHFDTLSRYRWTVVAFWRRDSPPVRGGCARVQPAAASRTTIPAATATAPRCRPTNFRTRYARLSGRARTGRPCRKRRRSSSSAAGDGYAAPAPS